MTDADSSPPEILNAVRRIAADDGTRPFLHWLFSQCRINDRSGNDFREGQRDIGINAHALLDEADPRIFLRLASESATAEIVRRQKETPEA